MKSNLELELRTRTQDLANRIQVLNKILAFLFLSDGVFQLHTSSIRSI